MCDDDWNNIDNSQVLLDFPMALKVKVPFNLVLPNQESEVKISVGEKITTLRSHDDIYMMSSVNHKDKKHFIHVSNNEAHLRVLDRLGHSLIPQTVRINTSYIKNMKVDQPYKICSSTGNEN